MVDDRYSKRRDTLDSLSKWVRAGVRHYSNFKQMIGHLDTFHSEMRKRRWQRNHRKLAD